MKENAKSRISSTKAPATRPEPKTIAQMKKNLSDALIRLKRTDDAINASFRAAEAYLDGLSLGFSADVSVYSRGVGPEHYGRVEAECPVVFLEEAYLEYTRVGERFRLSIFKERLTLDEQQEEILTSSTVLPNIPWDLVSLWERREAVAKLPDLLNEIVKRVDLQAQVAGENSAIADAFLSRASSRGNAASAA